MCVIHVITVIQPRSFEKTQLLRLCFTFSVFALAFVQNDLMEEARQVFSDWYSQVVRLYKGEKYVEFEWTVGPIPIEYVSLPILDFPGKIN